MIADIITFIICMPILYLFCEYIKSISNDKRGLEQGGLVERIEPQSVTVDNWSDGMINLYAGNDVRILTGGQPVRITRFCWERGHHINDIEYPTIEFNKEDNYIHKPMINFSEIPFNDINSNENHEYDVMKIMFDYEIDKVKLQSEGFSDTYIDIDDRILIEDKQKIKMNKELIKIMNLWQ